MLKINATRTDLDLHQYKNRGALEKDIGTLVDEPALVYVDGVLVMAYVQSADGGGTLERCRNACQQIKFVTDYRTNGMKTTSKIFGYEPRKTIRKDWCSATALSWESPVLHKAVLDAGKTVAEAYAEVNPTLHTKHTGMTEANVVPDYRVEGAPFTSGIINKNNPLKYHFDAGNYRDVWSGMITFRNQVAGGYLSCPELGLGFALRDKSILMFDGQSLLHGVTPFTKLGAGATRHTVVYYSLRMMWNCLPVDDEVARIRMARTEREAKRAAGIDPKTGTVL